MPAQTYTIGNADVECGGPHLQEIRSSDASEDIEVLRQRLTEDGYLCLRGLIPAAAVQAARQMLFDQMQADGALDKDCSVAAPRGDGKSYMGQKHVTHHPDFLGMAENPALFAFFDRLFGEASMTFDYKWARTVPPGAAGTQAHMDVVYMGRGSQDLKTCWIPIGDVSLENGPMCVLPGSHWHPATEKIRETYGKLDVDRDLVKGGWFTDNYLEVSDLMGQPWVSGNFQAGDVVIMGIYLMHGSIRNQSDSVRFTVDTRFQPKSHSIDERWVGENPIAHKRWWERQEEGELKTVQELRSDWGV